MADTLFTTDYSTTFETSREDFINYVYKNGLLNTEIPFGYRGQTFEITRGNIKEMKDYLCPSKYFDGSCYISNNVLVKYPFTPDPVEQLEEVKEEVNKSETPLIDLAQEILTKDDEHRKYGDMFESTERTAAVASVLFGKEVPTELVTIIYIAGKLCREGYNHKEDNLVDAIAYLEILNKIKNK